MNTSNLKRIAAATALLGALGGTTLGFGAGAAMADDDGGAGVTPSDMGGFENLLPLGDLANSAGGAGQLGGGDWQDFAGGGQWQDFIGKVPWTNILSAFGSH
jgi:hypothetical protein